MQGSSAGSVGSWSTYGQNNQRTFSSEQIYPPAEMFEYSLVDGEGGTHNHLFTLDKNGSLRDLFSFRF